MSNDETNESIGKGKETPVVPKTPQKTDAEKVSEEREVLKKENDAYEAEKLRAEQLRAEKIKGGKSEAGQAQISPAEELEKKAEDEAKEIVDAFR